MQRRKILISDSSEEFRIALTEALQSIHHVKTAGDGLEALRLLNEFRPDVLVLDFMLSGLDGISLLQKAAESGIRPAILATSRYVSDYTLDAAAKLGVGYVMVKPCTISATVARIIDLSERISSPAITGPDPRVLISNTLLRLGFRTNLNGYAYLREAIVLAAKDTEQSVTKELYPAAATPFGATGTRVERSIRSAIKSAWLHHDPAIWQIYFSPDESGLIPRPTNAAFISRMADLLILQGKHTQEE